MTVSMGATLSLKESCMHHTEVTGPFSGLVLVGDEGKLRLQAFSMHDNEVPAPQQVLLLLYVMGPTRGYMLTCRSRIEFFNLHATTVD